ncbi:MAG TPA: 50S ribosomal protein L1 [Pseudobdellovibrionaceae bacterium]|nr:50S ribosomal protein L1 [Pseudobdellovibrionaceae bacterium]
MAGKKYKSAKSKIDSTKKYTVDDALKLVVDTSTAKFDETVDVAIRLGVDPKQSDQQVRGAIALPHGLGKTVRVIVFAKGPKENDAKNAGADYVGADDLVQKIQDGWLDFDKCIATPDMMATVSKVAKILGPRGLMPNPKVGTVTMNVGEAVSAEKKGKLDFRVDKAGIIHAGIGKKSMGASKLKDNFMTLLGAVMKAKPSTSKGIYLRNVAVSSTMGPGVRVDVGTAQESE